MNKFVDIKSEEYPKLLREIKNPPDKLYYKGGWNSEIFENCLTVVGSRRLTSYGKRVTEQLVTEIAAAGVTIVSGFMYGGDEAAHQAAIGGGGRTIAVMPCGIEIIHPEYQEELYNNILKNKGLIVSEFEGKCPPAHWTYPKRNRIVAGLSKAVLIVEAGLQSGSLITAEFAKQFGRKIFAVPGSILSEVSKGTIQLLKEGASPVTSARDILKYYDIPLTKLSLGEATRFSKSVFSTPEKQIIDQLQRESLDIDSLSRILGIPPSKLGTTLSLMQLKGLIQQEGNKYYVD